jgi:hypothetical protein
LERLSAELCITLGEDDHQNVRALAKKADALWSLHGMKMSFSAPLASLVDLEEPSLVAAVASRGSSRGGTLSEKLEYLFFSPRIFQCYFMNIHNK